MGCGLLGGAVCSWAGGPGSEMALWCHLEDVQGRAELTQGQGRDAAPGHSGELPPSCCLAPRGGGGSGGHGHEQSDQNPVNRELAPCHGWGH